MPLKLMIYKFLRENLLRKQDANPGRKQVKGI